ncbi:TnsD family Tn7-like transposition protein [Pseudomonas lopnurensis]|uniref:TnsD family Tn7-like transposition protein n=1 Tax=Pseudomonas lopnurensis TaxID=1477517 RepID=UPI0028AB876E|nr:TnsD family Tn7-like transposition protein [Pseudomonas lopnurensis]
MRIYDQGSVHWQPTVALNWLEDETFFSVCSRQHVIWGSPDAMTTFRRLFQSEGNSLPHDFPHSLDALRHQMRAVLGDPDVIISRRTIFPFFRPFQSQEHVQAAINIMKGLQLGSIKYKLGLLTERFGAEHPLKACHACIDADINNHGTSYWHLCHQYPGVLICPIHNQMLQECIHNRQWSGRFRWTLPEKGDLTSWEFSAFNSITKHALLQLSRSVLDLAAVGNTRSFDPFIIRSVYRNTLQDMGLLNSISQKAAPSLAKYAALLQPYHPLTSLPHTAQKARTYIEHLVRNPRGHSHPLKHLVMINWLFGKVRDFIDAYDRVKAEKAEKRSVLFGRVDQYFQFKESTETTESLPHKLKPKVLKPHIRAEILRLLRKGAPKKLICSEFKLTISTVNKLLRSEPLVKKAWTESTHNKILLKNRSEWKSMIKKHPNSSAKLVRSENPKLYAWLYRNDKSWLLKETERLPTGRTGNNSKVDWALRDEALEALLITKLNEDSCSIRSNKVSNKDIYKLAPELSICLKSRNQYPRTRALLQKVKICHQPSKLH